MNPNWNHTPILQVTGRAVGLSHRDTIPNSETEIINRVIQKYIMR